MIIIIIKNESLKIQNKYSVLMMIIIYLLFIINNYYCYNKKNLNNIFNLKYLHICKINLALHLFT